MSHDPEENTVTPPDLTERPEVRRMRTYLRDLLERMRTGPLAEEEGAEHLVALQELIALLEADPTLAMRSETERVMDLIAELGRQLGPLGRQVALAREYTRLSEDPALSEAERARALNRLGKINPAAEDEYAQLRVRLHEVLQRVRELVRPDWHTPHRRRELAREMMPDPDWALQVLAEAADHLRSRVRGPLLVDPDLPEAHQLLELAARIEATGAARACVGPGCEQPLPPATPGRTRRYCSATCRTRARRAAAKR